MSEEIENASGYFQRPSFNAKERLVCSHLIEGINTSPLETILHTTQAALLLDDEALDNLEIDRDLVLSLFTNAQRLSNPLKTPTGRDGEPTYSLKLRTNDLEYDVYPWFSPAYRIRAHPNDVEKYEEAKQNKTLTPEQSVDFLTMHLAHEGYQALVSDFLFYATPQIQLIGGKLAGIVSPESYIELFRLIKGETP